MFVLRGGQADIVKAQITGSIIGTEPARPRHRDRGRPLGRDRLTFERERAGLLTRLLILVVIALLMPAVFDFTAAHARRGRRRAIDEEHLSLGVSIVLLADLRRNLVYTLVTRRDVFARPTSRARPRARGRWSAALGVLVAATALIALRGGTGLGCARRRPPMRSALSPLFIGVVVLALVGTASDLFAAAWFARQGKMGLVLSICIGSAIQVALVVAPMLVIGSLADRHSR